MERSEVLEQLKKNCERILNLMILVKDIQKENDKLSKLLASQNGCTHCGTPINFVGYCDYCITNPYIDTNDSKPSWVKLI
jgi:hypothetical protein